MNIRLTIKKTRKKKKHINFISELVRRKEVQVHVNWYVTQRYRLIAKKMNKNKGAKVLLIQS